MATYILKRLFWKLFSGIGRSGYPRYYDPSREGFRNTKNLPVVYDVAPLSVYLDDLKVLPKEYKKRVATLEQSLREGYIFENHPDDPDEYTHARPRANYKKWKVYSKDIDHEYRFAYMVGTPKEKIVNGELSLVVPVKTVECMRR